jgi:ABC-type transport system substrate-binding protein/class 3 adenylate cyclase
VQQHRGGTVTFVFTDIEGSTALVKHFKDRWPEVRSQHRRLVRDAFEAHEGDEVDTQGDSFFYVFGRARDAALGAAEATRALAAHEWPEGGRVRIRIGMHTGEPVVSEDGYHGIGVHRAARIMAAGHGGQVLLSEATAAVLRDEEVEGVGVKDLGVHRLKDLDRPEHVYQLVADGLEPAFPKIRTAGEEKPYYRRPLIIGAAAGVLAAAVAIPVFALAGGSGGQSSLSAVDDNAVGVVDDRSGAITGQTQGVDAPQGLAAGADAIWVSGANGTLSLINPRTHALEQTIPVGEGPQGIAVNGSDVWVANSLDGTVSRVSAETKQEVQAYPVGNTPTGVAVGGGSVWVTNAEDGTITQLDAHDAHMVRTISVGSPVRGIAYGGGALWVTDPVGNGVVRVPVDSPSAITRIDVGSGPSAIAYGHGNVWVANNLDGTVSRIDPDKNVVTGTYLVGASPNGIAVAPDAVWVSDEVDGTLVRVDPESGATKASQLGGRPEGVAAAGDDVFVAVQAAGDAHRGGHLRLLTPVLDSADPAQAYYQGTWGLITVTSDGLVGFKRVGGMDGNTIVPDLATRLPQPSDGGRTYSFQLEKGVRFSNGREVQPADVRATFERLFLSYAPDQTGKLLRSPRLDFYAGIAGAEACVPDPNKPPPKTCDLTRGITTSDADRSVTFHLTKPDPEFLYKLAVPFASIVPAGSPARGVRSTRGTGPYMVAKYTPYARVHLVRNPYFRVWSRAAQPPGLPDTIDLDTRLGAGNGAPTDALAAFRATVAGRVDLSEAGVPASEFETARTQYPAELHATPQSQTQYIALNTHRRPFSNELARRAVAYALDRKRMDDIAGGSDLAKPTCQLLPPGFPAYKPYCPYTVQAGSGAWTAPDLTKAKQLVAQSGTRGAPVNVVTTDQTKDFGDQNLALAATLRSLGYRVHVKHYKRDGDYFGAFFNDSKHIDAIANGWVQDYPAPANFFSALTCTNNAYTCDQAYDRQLARITAAAGTNSSSDVWTKLDREVTDRALLVPFINPKAVDFVSKRLGNYQHHPNYGLLVDQVWVR